MLRPLLFVAFVAHAPIATAQGVKVTLSEWKVRTSQDTVPAGPVTFQVSNAGVMSHRLTVLGGGVDKSTRDIAAREAVALTVTLKPGSYELYCAMSEDSHKMAGMTRTIVVVPNENAAAAAETPEAAAGKKAPPAKKKPSR